MVRFEELFASNIFVAQCITLTDLHSKEKKKGIFAKDNSREPTTDYQHLIYFAFGGIGEIPSHSYLAQTVESADIGV